MATPERIEELKINLEQLREELGDKLHEELAASHWDEYKYTNGIRPRWIDYSEMSALDILVAMDDLVRKRQEEAEYFERVEREAREAEERALTQGVGELPEPQWKQQLREAMA